MPVDVVDRFLVQAVVLLKGGPQEQPEPLDVRFEVRDETVREGNPGLQGLSTEMLP